VKPLPYTPSNYGNLNNADRLALKAALTKREAVQATASADA
jgi:hypothetical protein